MLIRFNPTATALFNDGSNVESIRGEITRLTGKPYVQGLEKDKYYVVFMCDVYVMDENQFRASQGLV